LVHAIAAGNGVGVVVVGFIVHFLLLLLLVLLMVLFLLPLLVGLFVVGFVLNSNFFDVVLNKFFVTAITVLLHRLHQLTCHGVTGPIGKRQQGGVKIVASDVPTPFRVVGRKKSS